MNSLIIGSDSLVGKGLREFFLAKNIKFWQTTRRNASADSIYFDFLKPEWHWLDEIEPDIAFICVAAVPLAFCEENPEVSRKINVDTTIQLIRRLNQKGTFVVFFSSSQVFDGNLPMPKENSLTSPKNNYGKQKATIEKIVQNKKLEACLLRITKIVSSNLSGNFGHWCESMKNGNVITPASNMFFAPVTLEQVVEVAVKCADKKILGTVHLSASKDISYADAAIYLAEKLGHNSNLIQPVEVSAKQVPEHLRQKHTALDTSRLSSELGIEASTPEDALNYMIKGNV